MRLRQIAVYLMSVPKTVYFNFRALPFKYAKKMPIFVRYNAEIINLKRNIISLDECKSIKPLMIKIGFNGTEEISAHKTKINLNKGKIIFHGPAVFNEGCAISVANDGELSFGNNFGANKNLLVFCNKKISIGDDVMFGWNCFMFDATGHIIYKDGIEKKSFSPIEIGNHCWICSESHILKGTKIADDCILAYGSLINKAFDKCNLLIGGQPAGIIQENVDWGNFNSKEHIIKNKNM